MSETGAILSYNGGGLRLVKHAYVIPKQISNHIVYFFLKIIIGQKLYDKLIFFMRR